MSGAGIEVNLADDARILQRLERLAEFELGPLLTGLGMEVETQTRRRLQVEKTGPDGTPWPAWSKEYARTRHSGHSLLRGVGHLLDSITSEVRGDSVLVGSPLEYAGVHQGGGTIRVPAHTREVFFRQNTQTGEVGNRFVREADSNFAQRVEVPAYSFTMPARPFLGVSEGNHEDLVALIEDYLEGLAND